MSTPKGYRSFEIGGWIPMAKNKVLGPRGSYIIQRDKITVGHFGKEFANLNGWKNAETKQHVKVTIQKGPRGQVEDYDNFQHYLKSVLDGLCAPKLKENGDPYRHAYGASFLVDDSPEWVEWELEQTWGKQKALRIEVWNA